MPADASWSVTDGDNTMGDTFAEGDLQLPATIVTNQPVPGGTYTVTVNAEPVFETYVADFTIDGDSEFNVVLTPVPVVPDPEVATVTAAAYACEGLTVPGLLNEIGDDCTPTSSTFDLYLSGDGTDEPAYTLPVDGSASIDVQVGTYEIWAADGTLFDLVVPAEGASFAYGYPAAAPAPEPGIVTIVVSSANPDIANAMPSGSSWTVSDGENSISDEFAEGDLALPATIVTNNPIPGGTYTATVDAGPDFAQFSEVYTVDGDTSIEVVLIPVAAEPELATLNVSTFACEGVSGEPIVLGEIGPDCTQISTNLSFYLWGDGTDDSWSLTTNESGAATIELPVGDYEVVNEVTQATVGIQVPAGNSNVAIGYPAEAPVETGTVTANVWHCLALETPGMLTEIGDDCIPGPAAFDFYLIGDGTDDSTRLIVGEDGTNSVALPVGEYEVYEVSTDTRLDNVVVTAGGNSVFNFGIPRTEAPPSTTGILSVSTYICEDLDEAVVLGEIGDDCVRSSSNLSFYLWGDGTDDFWTLTTSSTAAVDIELLVGDYEVIDEPTQWSLPATVVEEGSSVAFGFPAHQAPVDPPADPPADPADPPVTELPETGTGTGSNVGALGALVSGALLAAGALGVRIRKS